MAVDDLSQKVSVLSQRLEGLHTEFLSDPTKAPEILSNALESLHASLRDLSDAEKALKESEEKFQLFVDFAYDCETWLGPDGNYVYVSPSCKRITGYSAEEFMRNSHLSVDIVHPEDRESFEQHRNQHFTEKNGSAHIDYRIITIKGETRWVSHMCQPVFGRKGEWLGRRASNRDITEHKMAEVMLSTSKEQLKFIIDNSSDVAYRRDLRIDRFDYLSPAIEEVTGFSIDEMYAFRTDDMTARVHPDDLNVVPIKFKNLKEIKSVIEYRFKCKDGMYRWLSDSFRILADSHGNPHYRIGVVRNITERKKMEEDLRRSKDELEQRVAERTLWLQRANEALQYEMMKHKETAVELLKAKDAADAAVEAKAEFLANMSHEIRTPLNAVIGLTGILLNMDLKPDQKEYIETIRSSGDTLLAVINDILDFSKIDSGKMKLEYQPFDLQSCVEDSLDLVAQKAKEKGLNLAYRIENSAPSTIVGDPTRLRQILINLLSNAVKFTEQGSVEVFVTSEALDDGKCNLHIAVRDSGIGIPQDKMDKIFQSFSQADMSTTRKYGGTGLGLAISKRLVEVMGGEIRVESVEGIGSTFHFTLPVDAYLGHLPKPEETLPQRKSDEHVNLRILLAEDNTVNQKVMLHMLKYLGYRADIAANGVEVLKAMELESYDLVLMDIQMPEMDGFETAQEIRRRWPNGPMIIALTAYAMDGDREKCLCAGMDDYIAKPVKVDDLVALLNNVISTHF